MDFPASLSIEKDPDRPAIYPDRPPDRAGSPAV